jgi:hypothetical protein
MPEYTIELIAVGCGDLFILFRNTMKTNTARSTRHITAFTRESAESQIRQSVSDGYSNAKPIFSHGLWRADVTKTWTEEYVGAFRKTFRCPYSPIYLG